MYCYAVVAPSGVVFTELLKIDKGNIDNLSSRDHFLIWSVPYGKGMGYKLADLAEQWTA